MQILQRCSFPAVLTGLLLCGDATPPGYGAQTASPHLSTAATTHSRIAPGESLPLPRMVSRPMPSRPAAMPTPLVPVAPAATPAGTTPTPTPAPAPTSDLSPPKLPALVQPSPAPATSRNAPTSLTPALVLRLGRDPAVTALAIAPDGHTVVSGSADGCVVSWDTNSRQATAQRNFPPKLLHLSADGKMVASVILPVATLASSTPPRQSVNVAQVRTGQLISSLYPLTEAQMIRPLITALTFSPDGRVLAIAIGSIGHSEVQLWDIASGAIISILPPLTGDAGLSYGVPALAFAPDGGTLAVSSFATPDTVPRQYRSKTSPRLPVPVVGIYDLMGKQWRKTLPASRSPFCLSPDSSLLAAASVDRKIVRVWDVATGKQLRTIGSPSVPTSPAAFAPDGQHLWCDRSGLKLWDVNTGALSAQVPYNSHVAKNAFSPDGNLLARGLDNGTMEIWRLAKAGD